MLSTIESFDGFTVKIIFIYELSVSFPIQAKNLCECFSNFSISEHFYINLEAFVAFRQKLLLLRSYLI